MTTPDKPSGVQRGRGGVLKDLYVAPYDINSDSRRNARPRDRSASSSDSNFSTNRDHYLRSSSHTGGSNAVSEDTGSLITGNEDTLGLTSQTMRTISSSPRNTTPRQASITLPASVSALESNWGNEPVTPYTLGFDFQEILFNRFNPAWKTPSEGGANRPVARQFIDRMFESLSDAVMPYLDDEGTRASDIDTDLEGLVAAAEDFLAKAKGWQRTRASPGFPDDLQMSGPAPGLQDSIHNPANAAPAISGMSPFEKFVVESLKGMENRMFRIENPSRHDLKGKGKETSPPASISTAPANPTRIHPTVLPLPPASQAPSEVPQPSRDAPVTQATRTSWARISRSANPVPIVPIRQQPAPKPRPNSKANEVRLVIRFKGAGPVPSRRFPPSSIKQVIDPLLLKHAETNKNILLYAQWNSHGNLILAFSPRTDLAAICAIKTDICNALNITDECVFSRDVAWSKVMYVAVPTGLTPAGSGNVHSEYALKAELIANNPHIAELHITQNPWWVMRPDNLQQTGRFNSSVSLVFEDPDGSIVEALTRTRTYAFGSVIYGKVWIDKPVLRECTKCLALTHTADRCRKTHHCDICGLAHQTTMHRPNCKLCKRAAIAPETPCAHPPVCINCKGPHRASTLSCPARSNYRVPIPSVLVPAPAVVPVPHTPATAILTVSAIPTAPSEDVEMVPDSQVVPETPGASQNPIDPWWGQTGVERSVVSSHSSIYGTVNSQQWVCLTPATNPPSRAPGAVIYYRKGLSWLNGIVNPDFLTSPDVIAVDFYAYGFRFQLVNIYLHGTSKQTAARSLIEVPVDLTIPVIYAGDFNLHHAKWSLPDSSHSSQTGAASDLAEWIDSNDMTLLNHAGVATRIGRTGQQDSVLDLTLANSTALDTDLVSGWLCSDIENLKSDHCALSWSINIPADHVPTVTEPIFRYTIDSAYQKEWVEAFKAAVTTNPLPDAYVEQRHCEEGALRLLDAMSNATQLVMPKTKIGSKPPRAAWWNDDCDLAKRNAQDCSDDEAEDAVKILRQVIRKARRDHASRVCAEITLPDVFKLTAWTSGKRATKTPPIRFGNGFATNPEELAHAFQGAFFPSVPPAADSTRPLGVPAHPTRTYHSITTEEIKSALASSSNKSAPGAFGSNYRVLKWVFEIDPEYLAGLYDGCLNLGFHPMCLRGAVVAVVPKPRKPDMSDPRAYRPISLLECLSKCLEKIISSRLLFDIGRYNLIPYTQFGGRDNSSCVDAGAVLVHDVESSWADGSKASLLTLDVKGYFDCVNHARLIYTLRRLGFSHNICDWVLSYLSDRYASFRIDSVIGPRIALSPVGIPQGSPLSPVLSSIYSLPLLVAFDGMEGVSVRAYVDDFTILAVSHSYASNVATLQAAADVAGTCLRDLGLSYEFSKCELIHFASRKAELASNPSVNLTRTDGGNHVLRATSSIRWLGFYLDRRLDFKDHTSKMAIKALSVISGIRLLANSVRGLSVVHARLLYRACVIPVLTYGSAIWYRGPKSKALLGPLVRAQNLGLRWILGAFRTSPINAMEHVAAILPVPLLLQRLSENAATRLRRLPPTSEVAKRLPHLWDTHSRSVPQPAVSPVAPTIIQHLASLSDPEAEHTIPYMAAPWDSPHPWGPRIKVVHPKPTATREEREMHVKRARAAIESSNVEGALACFTDGSKRIQSNCRRTGAGYVIYGRGKEVFSGRVGLGPRADVFDAEMLGLALAAQKACALAIESPIDTIRFFVDNMAAVRMIADLSPHAAQSSSIIFRKAIDLYLYTVQDAKVEVIWVPGHKGISGNERADRLANEGGTIAPEPLFDRTITWARFMSRERAVRNWNRAWQSGHHSAHVMSSLPGPPTLHHIGTRILRRVLRALRPLGRFPLPMQAGAGAITSACLAGVLSAFCSADEAEEGVQVSATAISAELHFRPYGHGQFSFCFFCLL
ncbi:hypothetical protein FRC07_003632 [Ceratobasidium sp. 392]|nr:hypothetical protein FRC07_003632 [Ceratobasidium sp. 392]